MSSITDTHKDGVEAMVYAPNVGGTQINPNLATCRTFHHVHVAHCERIEEEDGVVLREREGVNVAHFLWLPSGDEAALVQFGVAPHFELVRAEHPVSFHLEIMVVVNFSQER